MSVNTEEVLKNHALRITKVRMQVLEFFFSSSKAISHAEIEEAFEEFDRVTIYRTLHSFLEKGLLHKVPDDTGIARYALCHTECDEHAHHDNHVHFKCDVCEKVECLHEVTIPQVSVKSGYVVRSSDLLIQGKCPNCSH